MQKIMFLGGSTQQVPAIIYAKNQGYHAILCDYLTDNPGQYYADEFYLVSTTDKEAVYQIAKEKMIDGILAYASDPAASTAAYVGEKLGLPSNPYKAVEILSRKDLFRRFLKENGFNCPMAKWFVSLEEAKEGIKAFEFPVMVKPVDSSGSKGVTRVDSIEAFDEAFAGAIEKAREKSVIVEEYIVMAHECMIGGDGFVLNGKLEFCGALNSHRDTRLFPFVPIGTSYPVFVSEDKVQLAKTEIQRLLTLLGYRMGAINIEVMFDKNDKPYIIEIGPRNGGNMIPELLFMVTGVDMIRASVETALGNNEVDLTSKAEEAYYSTYVIHSLKEGILEGVEYLNGIEDKIIKEVYYKMPGSKIEVFNGANKALGILFFKFGSLEELHDKMNRMGDYIKINLNEKSC